MVNFLYDILWVTVLHFHHCEQSCHHTTTSFISQLMLLCNHFNRTATENCESHILYIRSFGRCLCQHGHKHNIVKNELNGRVVCSMADFADFFMAHNCRCRGGCNLICHFTSIWFFHFDHFLHYFFVLWPFVSCLTFVVFSLYIYFVPVWHWNCYCALIWYLMLCAPCVCVFVFVFVNRLFLFKFLCLVLKIIDWFFSLARWLSCTHKHFTVPCD